MANRATPIQLLRSALSGKRPDPAQLLPGQGAVNINPDEPGLYFADSDSGTPQLFKVGPCAVGALAPNTGAVGPGSGNTKGELWLDMSASTLDRPRPILKVWDGAQWVNCMPYTYANTIISDSTPDATLHPQGTLWWDSSTGLMYVLYSDKWTQISSSAVS